MHLSTKCIFKIFVVFVIKNVNNLNQSLKNDVTFLGGMTCIPHFIKIYHVVRRLLWGQGLANRHDTVIFSFVMKYEN